MEKLGSHEQIFMKLYIFRVFQKSFENIQVSLKSNKHSGHFTGLPTYIYVNISPNSF